MPNPNWNKNSNNLSGNNVPAPIITPENTTATNMWAWIYNELQRITTYELNPYRLRAFRFDSDALMPYHATLQTITLMFGEFLDKDFPKEKINLDKLFNVFLINYNKSKELINGPVPKKYVQDDLNACFKNCLDALKLADELLARIRQEKGFGYKENVSFVINDRASKAIRINNDITKIILNTFKKQKLKKDVFKDIDIKINHVVNPDKFVESEVLKVPEEEQDTGICDETNEENKV